MVLNVQIAQKALFFRASYVEFQIVPYLPGLTCPAWMVLSGIENGSELLDWVRYVPDKVLHAELVTDSFQKMFLHTEDTTNRIEHKSQKDGIVGPGGPRYALTTLLKG